MPLGQRDWRPSRQRSPSSASMMTTGSVRGKCCALQTSHSRRQPAAASRVAAPQLAQKPWRACQERIALAWPSTASASARDQPLRGDRAQIDQGEVVAAGDDQLPPVEEAVAVVGDLLDRAVRQQRREHRRAGGFDPEQRLEPRAAEAFDFGEREERRRGRRAARQNRHVARDQHRLRVRPGAQRGDRGVVVAPLRDAVERRAAKAERRRARRCLEKGVIHASSLVRPALAKRRKAGFNPRKSFGSTV